MPKMPFDQDQPFATILEALAQNSENLKKTLQTLVGIMDAVDGKYEANTNKIIERINILQSDIKTLQTQIKNAEFAPLPTPPPPTQLNSIGAAILRFKNWVEFQIMASQAQISAYTYREVDRLFEVDAVKNNQVLVYIGEIPKVESMLKSWLSSQLDVGIEKMVLGTIQA